MSIPKINSIGVWVNPNEAAEQWAAQGLQQTRDMAQHGHEAAVTRDKNTKVTVPLKPQTISSKKEDAIKLQEQLTAAGYDLGKIDGIIGRKTNAALARAKADGYVWENGKLIKPTQELTQETPRTPITGLGRIPGLAGTDYGVTALGQMYMNKSPNESQEPQKVRTGSAFYINYPDHRIGTSGTGFEFLGKYFPKGTISGHAASIILDENGNATYHTYGRYASGKNGDYQTKTLPTKQQNETEQQYLQRIRPYLEYADNNEPVEATFIPQISAKDARNYYKQQPNKGKYSIWNGTTCSGEACRAIDAGTGKDSSSLLTKLLPDTPSVLSKNYSKNYKTYTI